MSKDNLFCALHPFNRENLYYQVIVRRNVITNWLTLTLWTDQVSFRPRRQIKNGRCVRLYYDALQTEGAAVFGYNLLSETGDLQRALQLFKRERPERKAISPRYWVSSEIMSTDEHLTSDFRSATLDTTLKKWTNGGLGVEGSVDLVSFSHNYVPFPLEYSSRSLPPSLSDLG